MEIQLKIPKPRRLFNDNILAILEDYETKLAVHYGGGSSGKSHGVYQKYVYKALKQWSIPRHVVVWRKVGATLRDSSFQHVKDVLAQFQILEYCKIHDTSMTITLPNGAQFQFKGIDSSEKIKSLKGVSDNIIEEATELNADDFTQIILRTRDKTHKYRQTSLMFNPVSKLNWVYKYFFLQPVDVHGATIYQSTYKDNRFIDQDTVDNLERLKNRNPAYYRIYALGEFATLDKLVFPVYEKRLISKDEVATLPIYLGLDFGFINDPSALAILRYDEPNKTVYVTDEYVKENLLNDQIASAITVLGYSKEIIHADSAEQKSIEEIRRAGIARIQAVKKGPDSIIQGIQWLQQNKIVVSELCFKTIEELENYTWKKDKATQEYTNEPVDSYNHSIDAIRYAISELSLGASGVKVAQGWW
jgi:phage terminase large subunit